MATTTNYGWETPDDTDYVYQGAAASRTTADSIDTTVYSLPQGVKSYTTNTAANLTLTTSTETSFFTGTSFTPVVGRLYLISYSVGEVYKTGSTGDIYASFRKNNAAGTLLNRVNLIGSTISTFQGASLNNTFTATGAALTAVAFTPCVTIQSTNNGVNAYNINPGLSGSITITDIGAS
jgi:hypothetical protein